MKLKMVKFRIKGFKIRKLMFTALLKKNNCRVPNSYTNLKAKFKALSSRFCFYLLKIPSDVLYILTTLLSFNISGAKNALKQGPLFAECQLLILN